MIRSLFTIVVLFACAEGRCQNTLTNSYFHLQQYTEEMTYVKLAEKDTEDIYGPHFMWDTVYVETNVEFYGEYEWHFVNTAWEQESIIHLQSGDGLILSEVEGLQESVVYEVQILPVGSDVCADSYPVSLLAVVSVCGVVGEIESPVVVAEDAERLEIVEMGTVAIYPNPTTGENVTINVANIESDVVAIEIFDVTGKLVRSEQIAATGANLTIQTSVSEFTSGLYTVRVTAGTKVMTERLQIAK